MVCATLRRRAPLAEPRPSRAFGGMGWPSPVRCVQELSFAVRLSRLLRGFRRGLWGLGLLCPSCGSSVFQRPAGPSWAVPRACALALVRRRAHRCAARMRDQRQHDGCDAEPPALSRPPRLFRSGPASFSRASAVLVSTGTRNSSWATCNYRKKRASESGRRNRCRIVYAYYAATQGVAVPRQRFFHFVIFF